MMRSLPLLAAVALVSCAASGEDFSGVWTIASSVGQTPITVTCTLAQSSDALSGSCQPQGDGLTPSDISGSVDGTSAKWGYDIVFNGNPGRVDYEGVLAADGTMAGTLFLSGNPAPFTATKR